MDDRSVFMFPDANKTGIDSGLLALLNQNGGFGGNGNWIWILFMWMLWGANGNGFGGNNGTGFLANQLSNNEGRDLLLQAINGRADALGQLASITNTSVESVKNGVYAIQNAITQVGGQVGMSGLDIKNAISSGDAAISRQLCECCCENRLAIANQTNAIQMQGANTQLQLSQMEGNDKLAICQQTNQLGSQADRNTNSVLKAIADQNVLITKEFCDLKERELQDKINTQGDIITQLRGQISNDKQTEAFTAAINALNEKINSIAAKQPNTIPVQYPNIVGVNTTPYVGYGYPQSNFWN